MTDGDAGFEGRREEIRQENAGLLEEFAAWLGDEDVGDKAIDRHVVNVDLFVNQFLPNGDSPLPAAEGPRRVAAFLGGWLARNALWIDADAIRRHADSLRQFYAFMHRTGRVDDVAHEAIVQEIRARLPHWVALAETEEEPLADDDEDTDSGHEVELRVRRSRPKAPRGPRPMPRGGNERRRPDRAGQAAAE